MGNISTLELGCKFPGLDWPLTNHAVSLVTHTAAPRKQRHNVLNLSIQCLINPGQEESVVMLESSGIFCGPNMVPSLKQRCPADLGLLRAVLVEYAPGCSTWQLLCAVGGAFLTAQVWLSLCNALRNTNSLYISSLHFIVCYSLSCI